MHAPNFAADIRLSLVYLDFEQTYLEKSDSFSRCLTYYFENGKVYLPSLRWQVGLL